MSGVFSDLVMCVALDACGYHLVTGSKDTTCVLWDVSHICVANSSPPGPPIPKPMHVLHGHDRAVSCVALMTELDMVVSGSIVSTDRYLVVLSENFIFEFTKNYLIRSTVAIVAQTKMLMPDHTSII